MKPKNYRAGKGKLFFVLGCSLLLLLPFLFVSQELDGLESPGELSRVHSELEGENQCGRCHAEDITVDSQKCLACHVDLKQRISAQKGYHQDKNEGCEMCHTEHQGLDTSLIDLDIDDFDHSETGFELIGAHKNVKECQRCHRPPNQLPRKKSSSFLLKSSRCQACHSSPHPGQYPECTTCHTVKSWLVDIW